MLCQNQTLTDLLPSNKIGKASKMKQQKIMSGNRFLIAPVQFFASLNVKSICEFIDGVYNKQLL